MVASMLSICIRFTVFIVALYICLSGLFSQPINYPSDNEIPLVKNDTTVKNIIVMVVDGLRSDMISSPRFSLHWSNLHALIERGLVDCSISSVSSPTVTSPRVKAIATGRVPEFMDIIYNMDSKGITQPSWVQRLAKSGHRLEMYGDDTWIKLFPNAFGRKDGTSSFFVNDFHEVDQNVTRHLDSRLSAASEWDLMILHYLGLDHIGHIEGPTGPSIPAKLREMDDVVAKIVSKMEITGKNDWLVILTGDHGMSDHGSHGGGSFFEITTSLLFISPAYANVPKENCKLNVDVFAARSDQTDIATVICLLTGTDLLPGSIGVPSASSLKAFWPEPTARLRVLSTLLHHLKLLAGCQLSEAKCALNILVESELLEVRQLTKTIKQLIDSCGSETKKAGCESLAPEVEGLSRRVLKLMSSYQSRMLLHSANANLLLVGLACIFMWLIAASFCVPAILDIQNTKCVLGLKDKSSVSQSYTSMVQLLACFGITSMGLHLVSLTASSLIEEEHQSWYFLTTSNLVLLCTVLAMADHEAVSVGIKKDKAGLRTRGGRIASIAFILAIDRFLLRYLNQTGDRWINLPDYTDWLKNHENCFWLSQIAAWISLLAARFLLSSPTPKFRPQHLKCIWSLCLVGFSQLAYRITSHSSTLSTDGVHDFSWTPQLWLARLSYLCLLVDVTTALWFSRTLFKWTSVLDTQADHNSGESPVVTSGGNPIVSPVHTFGLLIALLSRPSAVILWAGVIIKETLLTQTFHSELVVSARSATPRAQFKLKYCVAMIFWMEGWVTFFQQGNANKFSTIDLAAGYVGLSEHSDFIFSLLITIHTFAGPLFWHLALFHRFFSRQATGGDLMRAYDECRFVKLSFASFCLSLLTASTALAATVCLFMHNHLFIWTVFAPKLFYMALLNLVFLPLLAFMFYV